MRDSTTLLKKIYPGILAIFFVLVCLSRSLGQNFSNGEIDFIFRLQNFPTWQQFSIWVENGNGDYVGTYSITDFIGRIGGGNRTNDPDIDAVGGNRLSALPIWAFKRGVIDTTYGIQNYYPPSESQPSYPADIDAVSMATPNYSIQRITWQLDSLPYGNYTCWIIVNRDYDHNQYHNYSWYRGQPSIVWNSTINVSDYPDSSIALDYLGYGAPDGSHGNINPPDSTITTAANLLNDMGGYRFKVVYNPGAPMIRVTSPNGGENWEVGNQYDITWTSNNVINAKLEYSSDGGTSWISIINSAPSAGSYAWIVPNTPSSNCLVRISDASNPSTQDISDAPFIISSFTKISTNNGKIPDNFTLSRNYPNPFNPTTFIQFELPMSCQVTLKIFTIFGEEVITLIAEKYSAGIYSYEWDASTFASGVYLYRLQAGDFVETRKMVLMK
jgi:hypothetical protein